MLEEKGFYDFGIVVVGSPCGFIVGSNMVLVAMTIDGNCNLTILLGSVVGFKRRRMTIFVV